MKTNPCDDPDCRICHPLADADYRYPERPWADVFGMAAIVILGAIYFVFVVQL